MAQSVWLPKRGYVIAQIERDAFAVILYMAKNTKWDDPVVSQGIAVMEAALAEADTEAEVERGRQERRAEAERIARETPVTNVRIRIIKRHSFKGGHVMQRGEEYDVERRVSAEWSAKTGEWTPEVSYGYYPEGGLSGYRIDAEYAKEI